MKPLVIIPTLNEASNIEHVLKDLFALQLDLDILVVDGQSTDGTADLVRSVAQKHANLKLINQNSRTGFGGAIRAGFTYALSGNYDPVLTMDGDRSHSPQYIKDFLSRYRDYDLIIGSRYIDGVRVEGWRFRKLLVSKLANMYVSYLLVKPIWDFTSGFRCYRRRFLQHLDIAKLPNEAYILQIELLHLAYQNRFGVKEIPFIYHGTKEAISKVSPNTKRKTLFHILKYRAPFLEILRHLAYLKKEYERFVDEYEELVNPPKLKNGGKFEVKESYRLSIGVMAYNEEKIIEKCLKALLDQKLSSSVIKEIIVVSSGSTDGTDKIVQEMSERENRIRLVRQARREGKASAINEFLKIASGDIAIVESADTVTHPETVEELIKPFKNPQTGMVGVHPIPVNDRKSFVGYCVHKLWELHHLMAKDSAKCGEMVAFRNIVSRIPKYTAVDEAAIEAILSEAKLKLAYAENALVNNKGPETLRDFIKQRRRIASGHRHLSATMGHKVSTQNSRNVIRYMIKTQNWTPREMVYSFLLVFVELYSRFMGMIDFYLRDKNPFIWDVSLTTKRM